MAAQNRMMSTMMEQLWRKMQSGLACIIPPGAMQQASSLLSLQYYPPAHDNHLGDKEEHGDGIGDEYFDEDGEQGDYWDYVSNFVTFD